MMSRDGPGMSAISKNGVRDQGADQTAGIYIAHTLISSKRSRSAKMNINHIVCLYVYMYVCMCVRASMYVYVSMYTCM